MTISFLEQLAASAARAPSADNCQPWRMYWTGEAFELHHAVRHPETNVFGAESHATLLSIGGLAENLDAQLAANGVAGQWQWSTPGTQPYGRVSLGNAAAGMVSRPFVPAEATLLRHTNRLPFARKPLEPDLVTEVSNGTQGAQRVVVLQERGARTALVKLVRRASEARFCNRDLHRWLFGSLRATPEEVASGDGLDVATLGLPPGGKTMLNIMSDWQRMARLNRLGAYRLLAKTEVGLISAAPALLCLVGSHAGRDAIDAGRLLMRTWTLLNARGAAVQPYYVVTDQVNRLHDGTLAAGFDTDVRRIEEELASLLGLQSGEMLHMILRVGYPKATPPRSRRLPLSDVFVSPR